jgi:hypothetical protein
MQSLLPGLFGEAAGEAALILLASQIAGGGSCFQTKG